MISFKLTRQLVHMLSVHSSGFITDQEKKIVINFN